MKALHWILLVIILQSHPIFGRKIGPEITKIDSTSDEISTQAYPTLQSPSDSVPTSFFQESTDFDLNFDSATVDPEILESIETTTNFLRPDTSHVERRFSNRRGITSNSESGPKVNPKIIFPPPALKPRPTASVISYNPTNYNRIVKRRKGGNNVEFSTEPPEDYPTTSPPSAAATFNPIFSNRKVTFGLRTNRPPIRRQFNTSVYAIDNEETPTEATPLQASSINRRIKITPVIRLPSVNVITPSPSLSLKADSGSETPVTASYSPTPPSFEFNPSYTVTDGIYRFKYSSVENQPELSSRRVHSEEFGITRESYSGSGDGQADIDEDEGDTLNEHHFMQEERTRSTTKIPVQIHGTTTGTGVPLHTHAAPDADTSIHGSEEEINFTTSTASLPPSYRNDFNANNNRNPENLQDGLPEDQIASPMPHRDESSPFPSQNIQPKQASAFTVTVTVTQAQESKPLNHAQLDLGNANINVSDLNPNGNVFNLLNLQVIPTPALPTIPTTPSVKPSIDSDNNSVGSNDKLETLANENHPPLNNSQSISATSTNVVASIDSNKPSEKLSTATTITSSKDFKSIYYTTTQHPLFSSTSYSFASSTEYSFFVPDDNGHGHEGHDHEHANYDGHHHSLEQDHSDSSEHNVEDENNTEREYNIYPSSTLSYWDTLGLKTVKANLNSSSTENMPSPSPPGDLDLVKVASTPQVNTEIPMQLNSTLGSTTATTILTTLKSTTTPAKTSIEDLPSSHELSNEENKISSSSEEIDKINPVSIDQGKLPDVAVLIQVLLDMPAVQFCPSANNFKEMIILVYRRNKMEISLDQVVLFSVPDCNTIRIKHKGLKGKVLRENDSHNKLNGSGSFEYTPSMAKPAELYAVYLYLNDKNGSYNRTLTESFIDLWNSTRSHDDVFFSRIKKIEMITSGQISHAPANENSGIIAAITIASIAAVCLLLLGVLLVIMKHRQTQNKFAKRCTPVTLDDYSLDNISVFNSFRRKLRNRASKRSFTNAGFDDPNAPTRQLDVAGLEATVKEISSIQEEFSKIPNVNPTLDDIPQGAEAKNRFANVIPLPDTRVLLTFQDEQPNSDYINANFVRGANNTNKGYIITQGPLEETVVDFWRMIWEQQVRVIFMLTDFAEAGIPKCAEYYPRSETIDCSQLHGDYQVTLERRDVTENCITSYLVVKDMERSLRRDVVHFWFHSWPEKGVPDSPKPTVDFLMKTRKFSKESCPVVVHCSPGTGRSGTIVACDIGIKELETQRKVDIPQIVKRIRQDRAGAVQTKEQYRYIYDVIQYYSSKHLNSIGS